MKKQYGADKGESVFYASRNKGVITGVEVRRKANKGGLMQGFRKVDPKNKVKVQGHKAYKKFVSWS